MKQLFLPLLLAALAVFFFPKTAQAQLRYGLKAGVQLTGIHYHLEPPPTSTAPLLTSFAGALAEYETSKNVVLSAGLQVAGGGGGLKFDDPIDKFSVENRYSLIYVQLPVMVRAQHRGFSVGAGLYTGLALWGRSKTIVDFGKGPNVDRSDIQFGTGEDADYARFDWGALAEAGYSFRNFRVAAHYWLGLANVLPEYYRTNDDSAQNRSYGASLTYYLGEGE